MIIRIVKLTFKETEIDRFKSLFEQVKEKIIAQEGCEQLQLLQDVKNPKVFFTYSHWQSEDHLNAYRHSEFFGETWKKTKALFDGKPEAWSVNKIDEA